MKVHNLLVTGSLTSGGENITSISSSVSETISTVSSSISASINDLSSSMVVMITDMSSSLTSSIGSMSSSMSGRFDTIESTTGSLNSFTSSANNRLNSIEGVTGSYSTTGSNLFVGTQTISGSIIPAVDNTYDLGTATQQFRDLYLSSASLYIDGTKVLGSTSQELQITTDVGQSFKILEDGSDTITLQSGDGNITLASSGGGDVILDPTNGIVALKGTTTVYAGNRILSSDGNNIHFGNGVTMTGSLTVSGYIETQELRTTYISSSILYRSGSTKFGDELSDTHDFTGSLNISGSVNAIGSGLVSGSSQISYGGISGVPSGIISGSSQLPSGIISGSSQLPSGVISGSAQVTLSSTTGYGSVLNQAVLTSSSPTFAGLTNNGTYSQATTSTQPIMIYGDSAGSNGFFRIQIDEVNDSFGTGARTYLGDGGIDIFLGTGNSSYTPSNTYIALNHSGEISMGAGSATKHFTLSTTGAATFSSSISTGGSVAAIGNVSITKEGSNNIGEGPYVAIAQPTQAKQWVFQLNGSAGLDFWHYNGSAWSTPLKVGTTGAVGINSYTSTIPLEIKRFAGSGGTLRLIGNDTVVGMPSISFLNDNGNGGASIGMTASNQLNLNGTAYVNPSGNFGIGYSDPQYTLQVNGNIGLRANSQNIKAITGTGWGYSVTSYKVVMIGDTSNFTTVSIGYDPSGNANSSFSGDGREVLFRNGASFATPTSDNTAFHLNTLVMKDGMVGFGTADPNAPIDVVSRTSGSSGVQQWSYNTAPLSYRLQLNTVVTTGLVKWSFNMLNAGAGYSNVLVLDRGNVGVGTDTPATNLDVSGGNTMTGGWNKNTTLTATFPVLLFNSNGTRWAGIGYDYTAAMRLWVNGTSNDVNGTGTQAIAINNNGNVGVVSGSLAVGMETPSHRLDVNGNIRINQSVAYLYFTATTTNRYIAYNGADTYWRADGIHYFEKTSGYKGSWDANSNLTVNGTITESSALRYKENIEPLENSLDKILRLRGVSYTKKETGLKELGFIAEEVNEIIPELILKNPEGEIESVAYGRFVGVLVEAIKELKAEIEELKSNR